MEFKKTYYSRIGEEINTGTHESGLEVYVLPKKGFGKSYAIFATRFGSINNKFTFGSEDIILPDGVAHFLEHKLFEEPDGNAFDKFSVYGASANAFTSFDMTAYLFSATSHFYDNLEILLKFVQNPYFTEENVQKEQGIIGQEITMYQDNADWCLFFNMLRAMYKTHPITIDIAGTIESIAKIDKDLLYKCYGAFYNPKNMALFVIGDVAADEVLAIVDKCIEKKEIPEVKFSLPKEDDKIKENLIKQKFCVSRPMFALGFKEKPMKDAVWADAAYAILCEILFSKSSALYEKLYNEKLISPGFGAEYSSGMGYAFCSLQSETENPALARDVILDYIDSIRKNGIPKADFERAKKAVYGKQIRAFNNIEDVAGSYISLLFKGGDYLTFTDKLGSISYEDITALLEGALLRDKCVLSVVEP